jgi:hypothetical protein
MVDWNLDDEVLEAYIQGFYGQGRYSAKYWFVGMEFGGGGSVDEIVGRIQGWHDRGGQEVEDVVGPDGIGAAPWFTSHPPLQPTWAKLIRVVLSAEGPTPTTEQIRTYQEQRLGRAGGLDCILELLPLPSPGLARWLFYSEHSRLPYLRDRATYTNHVVPLRIAHLQERIGQYHPAAVIFYGAGYTSWWREIAGVDFQAAPIAKVAVAEKGPTRFVIMQHPTAYGVTSAYFNAIGRLIAGAS